MTRSGTRGRRGRAALVTGALTAMLAAGTYALPGTAEDTAAEAAADAYTKAVSVAAETGHAQTEQVALAAARHTGKSVEVTGLRQERRDVFANPKGTFTAQEYTQPVRTLKPGGWAPVDDTLVKRADGSLSPKAATVGLEFSGGGEGPFATMSRAGREYSLTWPGGKLPAPKVEGSTARYEEVLPGVDLAVRAEIEGFGHYFIVKNAQAAANPELTRIELGLSAKGLKIEKDPGGGMRAVDAAVGGTVFEAAKAVMWDSAPSPSSARTTPPAKGAARSAGSGAGTTGSTAGTAAGTTAGTVAGPVAGTTAPKAALQAADGGRKASVGLTVAKNRLTLTPDLKLLRGKDTVYPVVVDPIPRTIHRSAWTGVMSGMPGEQDWAYSGSAGMGKCPVNYNPTTCAGIGVRRLLYTFPLSAYRGKQILSAQFSARVEFVYWADAKAEPVDLYRIGGKNYTVTKTSSWGNTKDDWSDYLATMDTKISPTTCKGSANLNIKNGELLSEVKAATADSWSSMSLGLRAKDESDYPGWKRICGNTFLKIEYNTPPRQVDHKLMSTNPGGVCNWDAATRKYTDVLPQLRAEARDPDHGSAYADQVKMQFQVFYNDAGGAEQSYTYDTGYKSPNAGTVFTHQVTQPAGKPKIPDSTLITWQARAFDGDAWGPWSSDGTPQRCAVMRDAARPKAPKVASPEYPDDDMWHHGIGTVGKFTFTASDKDVKEYRFVFDGEARKTVTVTGGAPATVTWNPPRAGRHWVTVEAYDGANNSSVPAHHEFLVTDGKQAAGQWNLDDQQGSELAQDSSDSGSHPGRPGTGVTFGAEGPGGVADGAAHFDGTKNAYLDSWGTVMDTGRSFSVSAWVKPTALNKDMAVISQDSTGEPGFVLGYDATDKAWSFSTPDMDVDAMESWKAVAPAATYPVKVNEWVLLTGVYDAYATAGPQLRLYVNDKEAAKTARHTAWSSIRSLQIGRVLAKHGYRDNFEGDLAEVRAYDRVLPQSQIAQIITVKPQRKGYWPLEAVGADSNSANVQAGGQPLALHGATIYKPADEFDDAALVDGGSLALDGTDDWAGTATPVVTGADSYTVAVRAKLTTPDAEKSQTVLSLPGQNADRITVRFQGATKQWELALTDADSGTAKVTTVTHADAVPGVSLSGTHLAVVYDAVTHQVDLYVDGQPVATASDDEEHFFDHTTWASSRGLQVGRSALGGGDEYFAGSIDEVRVYAGAADATAVGRMNQLTGDPDL